MRFQRDRMIALAAATACTLGLFAVVAVTSSALDRAPLPPPAVPPRHPPSPPPSPSSPPPSPPLACGIRSTTLDSANNACGTWKVGTFSDGDDACRCVDLTQTTLAGRNVALVYGVPAKKLALTLKCFDAADCQTPTGFVIDVGESNESIAYTFDASLVSNSTVGRIYDDIAATN
jgi:hypothetical protein